MAEYEWGISWGPVVAELGSLRSAAMILGGESFLNMRFEPQRVICVSLFVCISVGLLNSSDEWCDPPSPRSSSLSSLITPSSSSLSDCVGLNRGLCKSLVSNSLMLLYLSMGFLAMLRSRRSCAELAFPTLVVPGLGLGGGVQSTAVWRGP